jgi:hypothetical protein
LESISFEFLVIEDKEIAQIVNLCPKLTTVSLSSIFKLKSFGISELSKCKDLSSPTPKGLSSLTLKRMPSIDWNIVGLGSFKTLTRVSLANVQFLTDEHIEQLAKNSKLRSVELEDAPLITELAVLYITGETANDTLTSLSLVNVPKIDENALNHIAKCKNLASLTISGDRFEKWGDFLQALPIKALCLRNVTRESSNVWKQSGENKFRQVTRLSLPICEDRSFNLLSTFYKNAPDIFKNSFKNVRELHVPLYTIEACVHILLMILTSENSCIELEKLILENPLSSMIIDDLISLSERGKFSKLQTLTINVKELSDETYEFVDAYGIISDKELLNLTNALLYNQNSLKKLKIITCFQGIAYFIHKKCGLADQVKKQDIIEKKQVETQNNKSSSYNPETQYRYVRTGTIVPKKERKNRDIIEVISW